MRRFDLQRIYAVVKVSYRLSFQTENQIEARFNDLYVFSSRNQLSAMTILMNSL